MHTDNDTIQTREFALSISCNNAAFDGEAFGPELAFMLEELAQRLRDGECMENRSFYLRDSNGNRCGTAEIIIDEQRR